MFERYTEKARRIIFFARYEASQLGSRTIESEHFLLGLLREDKALMSRFLQGFTKDLPDDITARTTIREKVSTSVDLPLSEECKRILAYAAEEAERLNLQNIGPAALLLGILREEKCIAAQVLGERGLKLAGAREALAKSPVAEEPLPSVDLRPFLASFQHSPALPKSGVVADPVTATKIAEAVWTSLYGKDAVTAQLPPKVELQHNVWVLTGAGQPENALFAFILQSDGRILSVGMGLEKQ